MPIFINSREWVPWHMSPAQNAQDYLKIGQAQLPQRDTKDMEKEHLLWSWLGVSRNSGMTSAGKAWPLGEV